MTKPQQDFSRPLCPEHYIEMAFSTAAMAINTTAVYKSRKADETKMGHFECSVQGCQHNYSPDVGYFAVERNDDHFKSLRIITHPIQAICGEHGDGMFLDSFNSTTKIERFRCPQERCDHTVEILAGGPPAYWLGPGFFKSRISRLADRFGIFSPLFQSFVGYGELLHLDRLPQGVEVVTSVLKCCQTSTNPHQEITRLLEEPDWRPHIVAAVAVAVSDYNQLSMAALWAAFDTSWVKPQLSVAAYLRDPNFGESAKQRIRARCPVDLSRYASMSPIQRRRAQNRSAKAAASLAQLMSHLSNEHRDWLKTELTSPDLAALIGSDKDQSARLAEDWLERLSSHLKTLGIETRSA